MKRDFGDEFLDRPGPDIWSRLSRWMWVILFLFLVLAFLILILPENATRDALKSEIKGLENQIAQQEKDLNQLREKIRLVREDPGYFEIIARDKLRLAKSGEHIIRITPPKDTATPSR